MDRLLGSLQLLFLSAVGRFCLLLSAYWDLFQYLREEGQSLAQKRSEAAGFGAPSCCLQA